MEQDNKMKIIVTLGITLLSATTWGQSTVHSPPTGLLPEPKGRAFAKSLAVSLGNDDSITEEDLPEEVILTDFLPPVGDQGRQNSCAAWATGYYSFTYAIGKRLKLTPEQIQSPEHEFSPAFIYNQRQNNQSDGMFLSEANAIIQKYGGATLSKMPYNDTKEDAPSEQVKETASLFAAQTQVSMYQLKAPRQEDIALILKAYLAMERLPIVVGINVTGEFSRLSRSTLTSDFVFDSMQTPKPDSGHAITVIGYNRKKHAFRIVNSWGKKWGDDGFLWVNENFLLKGISKFGAALVRPEGPLPLGKNEASLVLRKSKLTP